MSSPAPNRRVAIFGATSDIATAFMRREALAGARLFLVGRDRATLAAAADDLKVRGAGEVAIHAADLADLA